MRAHMQSLRFPFLAIPKTRPHHTRVHAQLYAGGVGLMETGDWRGAAAHFSRAMSVLNHEERAAMDEASRKARLAFW
jgi:hypothetical protein